MAYEMLFETGLLACFCEYVQEISCEMLPLTRVNPLIHGNIFWWAQKLAWAGTFLQIERPFNFDGRFYICRTDRHAWIVSLFGSSGKKKACFCH